jgi:low affinity Fe/Cu permease
MPTQTYPTHRRWLPIWHFFALPVTTINVLVQAARVYKYGGAGRMWDVLQAIAIMIAVYASRTMVLAVQNRLIRDMMRLKLQSMLTGLARDRIVELTTSQLIGLRFASNAELPALVDRCLAGELPNAEAVKKAIVVWLPDEDRV